MKNIILVVTLMTFAGLSNAQTGNALSFDNIDDHVYVPAASALISNSTTISLSMWVYPQNTAPSFPDFDGFAGFRNNGDCDFYILQLSTTNIEARFRNSLGTAFDIVYTGLMLNTWQHFVLELDGTTLSLYHDGALVGSTPVSGTISNPSENFYIGMLPWPGDDFYFNGKMDEVSLWNKALTPAEISCVLNGGIDPNDTDLALYYKFNQGAAAGNNVTISSLIDSKGNINGFLSGFALTGAASNFVGGVLTSNSVSITDTLCPGATYIFGSQNITSPGVYYEAFPITGGCDSIVELTLTSPVINTAVGQVGPLMTAQQAGAAYQWIDCLNGNAIIPGATSQSYTATANGQYAVIVTVGGCSDTSVCVTVTNVGFEEVDSDSFSFGPNPVREELIVNVSGNFINQFLEVHNYLGEFITTINISAKGIYKLNTSQWPDGLYILSNNSHTFNKVIVKM